MSFRTLSLLCLVAVVCVVSDAEELQLPAKTCQRDSSDYTSCLRLAIQEAWPIFILGLPQFNFPPLDPFVAESFESTYENGEMRGHILAKNVQTYGLSKAKFLAVRPTFSDDTFRLEIDVDLPKLFIDGDYKAEGNLGTFKIGGEGYFNLSMEDIRATWDLEGHVADDRWVVEHFRTAPEIGSMKVYFSDLFKGNEEMNKAALAFVNQYWPTIYRGMMPYLSALWDTHLTELSNRIFSQVSFSKLFP